MSDGLTVLLNEMPGLFEHLNPLRGWESLELEAALAEALTRAGVPWVAGGH